MILCGAVSAANYTVGPNSTYNYTSISDAVAAATGGDTIIVYPNNTNPYSENVVINQNLTLTANGHVTVQPADTAQNPFTINSGGSGSTIQGFTITTSGVNSLTGIYSEASNCKILNNNITGFYCGISILGSNNEISGNTIDSGSNFAVDSWGINLQGGTNNVVSRNTIKTTGTGELYGISIWNEGQDNIFGNTIYTNQTGTGHSFCINIHIGSSNTVSGNTMRALNSGSNTYGVRFDTNSNNNNIIGNDIENPNIGVCNQLTCTGNVVNFNRIIASNWAIENFQGVLNAQYNWYGSNANPSSKIQTAPGTTVNYTPWLVLTITSSPGNIYTGSTSTIMADFTHDSAGGVHDPALGHFPDGVGVLFTTDLGNVGSKSTTALTSNGVAIAILRGDEGAGLATLTAGLDNQLPLQTLVNILLNRNGQSGSSTSTTHVNAASSTNRTTGMQNTGVPIAGLILSILMLFGGIITSKK